ncbi:LeuA family protein [Mycobacterium angelicum]|uniref:Pyruvate carboxyltransferase domain-containing protein n=1 Tax=Mycobacterium angelicum TaxID=470074 RepID=A0A1X0A7A4_MYCAN|nr:hypothetical protein [Mycobacterium angelicum]MCV7195130.1 hypothetical protein [Mycobacterium angelicum]ORA25940.1 hypothetical protein BST12_02625 [Mycobacterium angelicum]
MTADRDRVEIIDCTLRDGEQAPGVGFSIAEKVEIGMALDAAGVDMLDAGFPASDATEIEALQELRHRGVNATIGATARPFAGDIAAAERAHADEVFLFMPTSDARIEKTLGMDRSAAVDLLRSGAEEVAGRGMGLNIVFEDATRADPTFLIKVGERIADDGLTVRRMIPADSVGCATPESMTSLVRLLRDAFGSTIAICPHCHNDFGLATANTLAAVAAGATSLTCTVNGLGERAGNADLAEVAVGLSYLHGRRHGVKLTELQNLAELVERHSGVHTSFIKPVTGLNVFRHESGVHVDAMLKSEDSYEYLPSGGVGRSTEFVLGKHSGRALVRVLLNQAGRDADDNTVTRLLATVKSRYAHATKTAHRQLFELHRRFYAEHLSGVSSAELVQLLGTSGQPAMD